MERFNPPITAPEFPSGLWLNSLEPIQIKDQVDNVLLVDIFDYTCINCLRTLPYLRAWHARYEDFGFKLFGIHTPEFTFAQDPDLVKIGLARHGIHWPVILDNDQSLWTAYANRYWPSIYLIDTQGKIRYRHVGEGNYRAIEATIQQLLLEREPETALPEPIAPIHPEDAEGTFCAPTSPEIQLGSIFQIDLDEKEPRVFQIPEQLEPDRIYLEGTWRVTRDGIALISKQGEIGLRYLAAKVHAVLAPTPVDQSHLPLEGDPLYIQVLQDGEPLSRAYFGQDLLAEGVHACFQVDFPRLYDIVENPGVETHELRLNIQSAGLTFHAFSFGSCLSREKPQPSRPKE